LVLFFKKEHSSFMPPICRLDDLSPGGERLTAVPCGVVMVALRDRGETPAAD
jgi:hypothetical protein